MELITFLKSLCSFCDQQSIKHCVLRGFDTLPDALNGDIDLLVDSTATSTIIRWIDQQQDLSIINYTQRYGIWNLFIHGITINGIDQPLQLDIMTRLHVRGMVYMQPNDIFAESIQHSHLPCLNIPSNKHQLLVKHMPRMLLRKNLSDLGDIVKEYFRLWKHSPIAQTKSVIMHGIIEWRLRLFKGHVHRIALLGADGSGKTSLLCTLHNMHNQYYKLSRTMHVKPNHILHRGDDGSGTLGNPHHSDARGLVTTFTKLFIYLLEYQLDKLIDHRRVPSIDWYDRYFSDMLCDPSRYRLPCSLLGPVRFMYKYFIVKPNITLVVLAPENMIYERKQELSIEVIKEVNQRYKRFSEETEHVETVENITTLQEAGQAAHSIIIKALAQHTRKRLKKSGMVAGE